MSRVDVLAVGEAASILRGVTPLGPIDVLAVGDVWGVGGDVPMRVHRVDRAGGRVQLRAAYPAGPGKRWDFRGLVGEPVRLRRYQDDALQIVEGVVVSAMQGGVTLSRLRLGLGGGAS